MSNQAGFAKPKLRHVTPPVEGVVKQQKGPVVVSSSSVNSGGASATKPLKPVNSVASGAHKPKPTVVVTSRSTTNSKPSLSSSGTFAATSSTSSTSSTTSFKNNNNNTKLAKPAKSFSSVNSVSSTSSTSSTFNNTPKPAKPAKSFSTPSSSSSSSFGGNTFNSSSKNSSDSGGEQVTLLEFNLFGGDKKKKKDKVKPLDDRSSSNTFKSKDFTPSNSVSNSPFKERKVKPETKVKEKKEYKENQLSSAKSHKEYAPSPSGSLSHSSEGPAYQHAYENAEKKSIVTSAKDEALTITSATSNKMGRIANKTGNRMNPQELMAKYPIPKRKLLDRSYLSSVRDGKEVLTIRGVNLHQLHNRHKTLLLSSQVLSCCRTNVETIAIFKIGNKRFISDIDDKPCLRPYRFHFVVSDENHKLYLIELPRSTEQEDVHKLEVMFAYYSRYYRIRGLKPGEERKKKGGAGVLDHLANGIEDGSQKIADVCVTAGMGIGKGAQKVSETYQKHAKPYTGKIDHEKLEKLKIKGVEKESESKSEGFAKGSSAVSEGIKDGFKGVGAAAKKGGNKAVQPIKDTNWYQKREEKSEKKKDKEELEGIQREPGYGQGAVEVFKAGWNATRTIKDGIGEGLTVGARGIRDAKVEATRHTDGDYQAEKTKQRWNAVGNTAAGVYNIALIYKTIGTIWATGATYAVGGAIKYDINKAEILGGAPWKEGWILWRDTIYGGAGYELHWAVLTHLAFAMYQNPQEPKPVKYFKLNGIRNIERLPYEASGTHHAFVMKRSRLQYFSTTHLPNAQEEMETWMNLLWSLSEFLVPHRVLDKQKHVIKT